MKKSKLLVFLSAGLLLTSCGFNGQQVPEYFVESDEAHEEIFGAVADQVYQLKNANKALVEDSSLVTPILGYQMKDNGKGTYSLRFVGAIASLDVKATWTKSVHSATGESVRSKSTMEATTAYTVINENSVPKTAKVAGEKYNYWVVYCLLNIPANKINNYFDAMLTLEKNEQTVSSDVFSVNLETGKSLHYNLSSGYTMFVNDNRVDTDTITQGNRYEKYGYAVSAGDKLLFRDFGDMNFVEYGYDSLGADSGHGFTNVNNSLQVNYNTTLNIFFNYDKEIWVEKKIYFQGPDWWRNNNAACYLELNKDSTYHAYEMAFIKTNSDGTFLYYSFINAMSYSNIQFYRDESGAKYNHTGFTPIPEDVKNFYTRFNDTEGSWSIYSE